LPHAARRPRPRAARVAQRVPVLVLVLPARAVEAVVLRLPFVVLARLAGMAGAAGRRVELARRAVAADTRLR
jgi:hypothetical protein